MLHWCGAKSSIRCGLQAAAFDCLGQAKRLPVLAGQIDVRWCAKKHRWGAIFWWKTFSCYCRTQGLLHVFGRTTKFSSGHTQESIWKGSRGEKWTSFLVLNLKPMLTFDYVSKYRKYNRTYNALPKSMVLLIWLRQTHHWLPACWNVICTIQYPKRGLHWVNLWCHHQFKRS